MECDIELKLKDCNCTYPCQRKGKCCECVRYHRMRGELPGCYFSNEAEAAWNRSVEYYIKTSR